MNHSIQPISARPGGAVTLAPPACGRPVRMVARARPVQVLARARPVRILAGARPVRILARTAGVALLIGALAQPSQAQMLPPPQNLVSLAAEASAEVLQDLLTITLTANREGSDAVTVQTQLRQVLDAALTEARKSASPGQVAVRSGVFSIAPRYVYKPNASPAISGWQGRTELLLEGRDTAAISQLAGRVGAVSGASGAGGMTVARVSFGLSREARETAESEVANTAIARFKARAENYARQFGFGSYSLREVSVGSAEVASPFGQPNARLTRAMAAGAATDEAQPVEAGKATVTVTVHGSIQLSPR